MSQDTFVNRIVKDKFYQGIGNRIFAERKRLGWSREKLADESILSVETVRKAEQAESCSVLVLTRIATALDVMCDTLVPIGSES